MRFYNKLTLAYRMYTKRMVMSLVMFLMCVVSFYMVDQVLQSYFSRSYMIDKMHHTFGISPKNVNYITFSGETATSENSDALRDYINTLDCVDGSGYYGAQVSNDLLNGEVVNVVVSQKELKNIGNLKLSEEEASVFNNDWDGYEPVLLGYNYRNKVEVGTIFTLSCFKEKDCIVAGFLDKKAAWPKSQGLFRGASGDDAFTLDSQGILLTDNYDELYDNYMGEASHVYYIADSQNSDKAKELIMEFAVNNNISASIINQGEVFEEERIKNNIGNDKAFIAAILLVVLAIVSISASTVIYCLMNKKEYGIMMINGLKQKDIIWIMIFQNAVVYVVSAIVAWIIRQYEIFGQLIPNWNKSMSSEIMYLQSFVPHNVYMPIIFVVVAMIMLIISSVLPIIIIRRMTLIEMLYSNK